MKKRCVACNTLNAVEAVACSSCKQSLMGAEEVYDEAANPKLGSETISERGEIKTNQPAKSSSTVCECKFPSSDDNGICKACDGIVPQAGESVDETQANTVAVTEASPQSAIPPRFFIHIRNQNIRLPLDESGLVLGRSARTPEILRHYFRQLPVVSRQHLLVSVHASELLLLDLGSHNGSQAGNCILQPLQMYAFSVADLPITVQFGRNCSLDIEVEQE